ncbi:MAG: rod shape-determining protein MreD [Candidatus Azambacteria bacterium]|nr:rod shape-determining protein MreD [Candidatus Azambacteria bacterium]
MKDYKKITLVIGVIFFLILIAGFQVSFINLFFLKANIFLIWIIYLVLTKNDSKALIIAWLGGILTGPSYFSNFGVSSLVLLLLAAALIVFYKITFLTLKTESVIAISVIGVAVYHFLSWSLINILALFNMGAFEEFRFYFTGYEIAAELALTILLLLAIFKIRTKNVSQTI